MDEISRMSESGYSAIELLEYVNYRYDELECELNGEVYEEPKKHDRYFCLDCKLRKIVDYEYLSTILFMCNHTIIRCDIREGNAYIRDLTILRPY